MVLFAKLTPDKIEASMFAFLMGLINLTGFISTYWGTLLNVTLIHDSSTTLKQNTWKLYAL